MSKILTQLLDNEAAIREIESHHGPAGATFKLVDHSTITVRIGYQEGHFYTARLMDASKALVTINVVTGAVAIGD